ncbi:MAG: hypothetical protein WKG32_19755 [Gemmatimonadaceae bacterium]
MPAVVPAVVPAVPVARADSPAIAVRTSAPDSTASPPAVAPPGAMTEAQVRDAIGASVAAYGRAIERQSVTAIREAYPGLTDGERKSWEDFFESTRDLSASLIVTRLDIHGAAAEANVRGTFAYFNKLRGRAEQRPVQFQGVFTRDAGRWRLSAIR